MPAVLAFLIWSPECFRELSACVPSRIHLGWRGLPASLRDQRSFLVRVGRSVRSQAAPVARSSVSLAGQCCCLRACHERRCATPAGRGRARYVGNLVAACAVCSCRRLRPENWQAFTCAALFDAAGVAWQQPSTAWPCPFMAALRYESQAG